MSKYDRFPYTPCPTKEEPNDSVLGTYLDSLPVYMWINAHPKIQNKMKHHKGYKLIRTINTVIFLAVVFGMCLFMKTQR